MPESRWLSRENSPILRRLSTIAFLAFTASAIQAQACSIPVFRYALEHWQPDPYVAYILHSGELTGEQQGLIDTMQTKTFEGTTLANLVVRAIRSDIEQEGLAAELLKEHADAQVPRVILQSPARLGPPQTVFATDFTPASVALLIESPLRATIRNRLLEGDSVVWVYLECGDEEKDSQRYSMLTRELSRLQDELELPEIEDQDLVELATDPQSLKIRFSAVRLSRDDPEEAALRDMLLHVEHDLLDEEYAGEPMAFPIFGRGRALYALVGAGVAAELIEEACRFLTGACQCTVKAENPGVDLLMQVEWDKLVQPTEAVDASLPPLAGFTGFGSDAESVSAELSPPQPTILPKEEESESVALNSDSAGKDPSPAAIETAAESAHEDHDNATATRSGATAVWQNVVYVLLLTGCVVVFTTVLLMRRSGV